MTMLPTWRATTRAPLTEASRLQHRLRQLFDEPFTLPFFTGTMGWEPPIDVMEKDGDVIVTAELPGMKKEDVELELANDVLTIKGEKKEETERQEQEMHVVERSYGSFRRSFTLPAPVDPAKVTAGFKDGVLRVTLPKTGGPTAKKITIG